MHYPGFEPVDRNLKHGSIARFDLREIFEYAHLKFTVYGRKQASTDVRTYVKVAG